MLLLHNSDSRLEIGVFVLVDKGIPRKCCKGYAVGTLSMLHRNKYVIRTRCDCTIFLEIFIIQSFSIGGGFTAATRRRIEAFLYGVVPLLILKYSLVDATQAQQMAAAGGECCDVRLGAWILFCSQQRPWGVNAILFGPPPPGNSRPVLFLSHPPRTSTLAQG